MNSNKLLLLPPTLSYMTCLRVLDARLNCLRSLPDDLENLVNLEVLNVSQNFHYLESLPCSVGLLVSLVELDVSYNNISTLPDSIGCLNNLTKLSVEGNPLVYPPPQVVEWGMHAVKEYLSNKINSNHHKPNKSSWFRKIVKYNTFNGNRNSNNMMSRDKRTEKERQGFLNMSVDYRSIDGLTSPRYMGGMFSSRRFFSPRAYFSR